MLLDLLNRDIFGTDTFSRLSDNALRALDEKIMKELGGPIEGSAAELRTPEENKKRTEQLIKTHVEIAKELSKRKRRWEKERGGFWVAIFFFCFLVVAFGSWLAAHLT